MGGPAVYDALLHLIYTRLIYTSPIPSKRPHRYVIIMGPLYLNAIFGTVSLLTNETCILYAAFVCQHQPRICLFFAGLFSHLFIRRLLAKVLDTLLDG